MQESPSHGNYYKRNTRTVYATGIITVGTISFRLPITSGREDSYTVDLDRKKLPHWSDDPAHACERWWGDVIRGPEGFGIVDVETRSDEANVVYVSGQQVPEDYTNVASSWR